MAISDILSIFQTKQPSAEQNVTVPNTTTPKGDGTGPTAFPNVVDKTGEKAPLEGFSKLWENDPNKKPDTQQPLFNADPKKLLEAAKTIDFAKVIPAEILSKITAGGAEASGAFSEAINAVTQAAYAQSAHATTKIVEAALSKQMEQVMSKLPDMVRTFAIKENLRAENPLFSNPATAPMLSMLETQIAAKNPTASAADVNALAKSFLTEFAGAITTHDASRAATSDGNRSGGNASMKKTGTGSESWEDYFGVSAPGS